MMRTISEKKRKQTNKQTKTHKNQTDEEIFLSINKKKLFCSSI